jgi:hypothetical protein
MPATLAFLLGLMGSHHMKENPLSSSWLSSPWNIFLKRVIHIDVLSSGIDHNIIKIFRAAERGLEPSRWKSPFWRTEGSFRGPSEGQIYMDMEYSVFPRLLQTTVLRYFQRVPCPFSASFFLLLDPDVCFIEICCLSSVPLFPSWISCNPTSWQWIRWTAAQCAWSQDLKYRSQICLLSSSLIREENWPSWTLLRDDLSVVSHGKKHRSAPTHACFLAMMCEQWSLTEDLAKGCWVGAGS